MLTTDLETINPIVFYFLCKYRYRYWKDEDIQIYQKRKLEEIIDYSVKKSKFFHNLYQGCDLANFSSLPTVNKQLMMDNLSDYNTLGLNKDELIDFALEIEKKHDFSSRYRGFNVGMSSGTSGNKGIIITTPREEFYLKAMYLSRLILPRDVKANIAFILRVSSPAFKFRFLGNSLNYISQLQTTGEITSQIESLNPNVISGPPSMLKILAQEFQKGKFKVQPKLIYSYAEVLYLDVKDYLIHVFNCPVHEIYQGSEGCYAMTCKDGNLHINEDMIYFELLDRHGSPTLPGNPCFRLLVTDLHKHSQPIIRYELNDIITISPHICPCGSRFRVIKSVQGRADDLIWGIRNGTGQKQFIYPDYIARKIISLSEVIDDYQVIQDSLHHVTVRIKVTAGIDPGELTTVVRAGIWEVFDSYDCIRPEIAVELGDPEKNPRSGKLVRIIGQIKQSNL